MIIENLTARQATLIVSPFTGLGRPWSSTTTAKWLRMGAFPGAERVGPGQDGRGKGAAWSVPLGEKRNRVGYVEATGCVEFVLQRSPSGPHRILKIESVVDGRRDAADLIDTYKELLRRAYSMEITA